MLDKTYRSAEVEARIYAAWEEAGAFAPQGEGQPYCIMLPPPNVTGSLHMGHALDHTIQDTLIRLRRMQGRLVLWQPGTDHAGIATQMVVERQLATQGSNMGRRELGRAAFVSKVWDWKEQSGGTIGRQMRRLGASPDWSRERFTMDDGLSKAVIRAFVGLHRAGLIYKDKRLVNWDVKLETAVSDLEVQQQEVDGHLWHLRYGIENEPGRFITVATTRPETMLGDSGIAVHPDDPRYRDLHGKAAILPLVGRRLPIVADAYSDPEKGTGAVKITPAHDFNDFEVGRRHDLELIPIMDGHGRISDRAPAAFQGLERFEARKRVIAELEALGLVERIERHRHSVPHGDRSGTPLEPFLTEQWYCNAGELALAAIAAVEDGRARFVPKQWENTYFEWMRNIQPWCISRQLWWGHQIPAWYAPDGAVFVEESEAEARAAAIKHYGREVELRRDPDVLDTWFSSGLWPFSTLGWPEDTPELRRFYPTDVLVTGFDIIFFWVARMMMLGLHFTKEVPFRDIYIHGLVRDEAGAKMSKTKGNVIDPLEMVGTFGADALRIAMLASTAQGRDIKFGPSRVEGYRNFVTKLWNAARFLELNEARLDPDFEPAACHHLLNRWLVSETARAARAATEALEGYRFNDAALGLYHFVWNTFCDWYVELSKPLLNADDPSLQAETRAAAAWAMRQILHLLHPLMPFVTEELWRHQGGRDAGMLITSAWPALPATLIDEAAEAELGWVTRTIGALRAARTELGIVPSARIQLYQQGADTRVLGLIERYAGLIGRMAGLAGIGAEDRPVAPASLQVVIEGTTFHSPLEGIIDLAAEQARLTKEIAKAGGEARKLEQRLDDAAFLARAPAEIVEQQRERLAELRALAAKLRQAQARLG